MGKQDENVRFRNVPCKAYYWEGDTLHGVDFLKDRPSKLF